MRQEEVSFYSGGVRIAALWRTPDELPEGPMPALVQGPGWLGLKDGKLYVRYHEALVEAGMGVLVIDYRGFGDSQGDRTVVSPALQLEDLINAVTYLTTREDVDSDRIGAFGTGGTGGGNAIVLSGADPRIRAVVSQVPVADGDDWLHRMRSEYEWLDYLNQLDEDRKERVVKGQGRLVHPREEIMIPTAERRKTKVKADVDERIPTQVSLAGADEIRTYKPIRYAADSTTPTMIIAVENDATTPTDHAVSLYEALQGPKRLVMQRHTSHYAAYDKYWDVVTPQIVEWYQRYLVNGGVVVREAAEDTESTTYHHGNR